MKPFRYLCVVAFLLLMHLKFSAGAPNFARHGGNHLMEQCNKTKDCTKNYPLVCLEGNCVCNSSLSKVSERPSPSNEQECLGLGNKPCVDFGCIKNAACVIEPANHGQHEPMCRCLARNHVSEVIHLNFKNDYPADDCIYHNVLCDNWNKCKFGRVCMNGICECPFPKHQYFNGTTCVSNLGGPCELYPTPNQTKLDCAPFATCSKVGKRQECVCPEGMVENGDGQCDLGYNQYCTPIRYGQLFKHGVYSTRPCDARGLLKCVDGMCKCPDDFHVYDDDIKKCRGILGAHCAVGKEDGYTRGTSNFCVAGLYCVPNAVNNLQGICKCKDGFEEDGDQCIKYAKPDEDDSPVAWILAILLLVVSCFLLLALEFISDVIRDRRHTPIQSETDLVTYTKAAQDDQQEDDSDHSDGATNYDAADDDA